MQLLFTLKLILVFIVALSQAMYVIFNTILQFAVYEVKLKKHIWIKFKQSVQWHPLIFKPVIGDFSHVLSTTI